MPFFRAKTWYLLPGLEFLAQINAISQANGSRRALLHTAPVPVDHKSGPNLLYRDFPDAFKHPEIHPRPKPADYLITFVSRPLRDGAPLCVIEVNRPHPFGGGAVETEWVHSVFARERLCPPKAYVLPGFASLTWQRVRRKAWQVNVLKRLSLVSCHALTISSKSTHQKLPACRRV